MPLRTADVKAVPHRPRASAESGFTLRMGLPEGRWGARVRCCCCQHCCRSRIPLSRRPSLVDLPKAARHLAHDGFLGLGAGRPLPGAQPDHGPLGRIEGVLVPLPPLVVVGRAADVPAGRRGVVDVAPGFLSVAVIPADRRPPGWRRSSDPSGLATSAPLLGAPSARRSLGMEGMA